MPLVDLYEVMGNTTGVLRNENTLLVEAELKSLEEKGFVKYIGTQFFETTEEAERAVYGDNTQGQDN